MKLTYLAPILVLPIFWLQQPDNSRASRPIIRRIEQEIRASAVVTVAPVYPPLAKVANVAGEVVVEVEIAEDGTVMSARSISGHPLLKGAAEAAATNWRFPPAIPAGQPVKVIGTITFSFQATDSEIDDLKTKIIEDPSNDRWYDELAAAYVSQRRYDDAIKVYEQAIKRDPTVSELHYDLGQVYFEIGKCQAAANEYRLSAELWPLLSVASWGLAKAEENLQHYELAIQAYKDAIHASESPEEMYDLGRLYNKLGRHEEALEVLEKAAEFTETWEELHFELGVTYVKTGRIEKAEQQYKSLSKQDSPLAEKLLKALRGRRLRVGHVN
jgi:TonB family protein